MVEGRLPAGRAWVRRGGESLRRLSTDLGIRRSCDEYDASLVLLLDDLGRQTYLHLIDEHGADAIGFFASAKVTNEENYLMQKFARAGVGTNNVDHCARL